jgi:hypothetical protein
MRIVGVSALLGRAQEFIGNDPRWLDVLAEEKRGTLTLYKYAVPAGLEFWQGHYLPWARVSSLDDAKSLFILSYFRDNKKWEDLEVTGHLEECLQAIKDNVYAIFF